MSYYLSNGPRSLFFNSSLSPPRSGDGGDSTSKSDTEPLQPGATSGNTDPAAPPPPPASTSIPSTSSTAVPKTTASSSVYDFGRMFKRPTYSSGILSSNPATSASGTGLATGLANSKPIVSSSSLYQAQPPRIIGSTSAHFGAGTSPRPSAEPEPVQSLKIAFRSSPSSSTVTTTPTSTAPGSVTHQVVTAPAPEVEMMVGNNHRNGPGSGPQVTTNQVTTNGNNCNSDPSASASARGAGGGMVVGAGQNQSHPMACGGGGPGVQLTLYGWRKKCLYTVILLLMVMIIINLALTLWILKVMEFSADGMGQLKIVSGGVELRGQALVLDMLRASSIRSRHGTPISIESSRNFSVNTRDAEGYLENQLFLGHDRFEVMANHFRVGDTHGTPLFAVDRDEVTIGASSLRVEGEGGVIFKDSIQTPLVRAEAGKDLKLESPTRSLEARATQEIFLQSRAGSIEANCLNDLKLHSVAGSIRLDASTILFPNLKTVQPSSSSGSMRDHVSTASSSASGSHSKIYQLCACSNGKLFLAPAHSICAADDSAICR
ncbi:uncharacterized protein LOC120428374 isoform X2 [Culex pipiens pallens]|nr:uncharacterized protein LOC120428374 isoform X2 [Culex pipiens pallens]